MSRLEADATTPAMLSISGAMLTHPGLVRENNEDVVAYLLADDARELFAVVADGIGGHLAGEVASKMAADILSRAYLAGDMPPADLLEVSIRAANDAIYELSRTDPTCAGMGTTCTALFIRDGAAFLGHVGDSRAYLWRAGMLHQMSEDQSLAAAMVRDGILSAEEAAQHPARKMILQALGVQERCDPAIWDEGFPVSEGDRWLLCSDGLSDVVDPSVIAQTMANLPPAEACRALIESALAAGAPDNVSVGVFVAGAPRA